MSTINFTCLHCDHCTYCPANFDWDSVACLEDKKKVISNLREHVVEIFTNFDHNDDY